MKIVNKHPLTELQACVRDAMLERSGIVARQDIPIIAEACNVSNSYVMDIVDARTEAGKRINAEVDKSVAYQPIGSKNRRLAYAQLLLDDKIARKRDAGEALTRADPIELLDYARKETNAAAQVNVQQTNIGAQVFDFSGMPIEQLQALIERVSGALQDDNFTKVIDAEFTEQPGYALADVAGCEDDASGESFC